MTNMAKYPKERQCPFCLNGGNKREKNLRLFSDQVKARDMNRADSAFAWLDKRILSESTNIYFCTVYDIDMHTVYLGVSFHHEYKLCALWVALHYTDARFVQLWTVAINLLRRCGRTSRRKQSTCSNNHSAFCRVETKFTQLILIRASKL